MTSFTLALKVMHVQDMHLDAAGAFERIATCVAAPPTPAPPAASVAPEAAAPPPYPNAVLGVPGTPQINFALHIRSPDIQKLFMKDSLVTVTVEAG